MSTNLMPIPTGTPITVQGSNGFTMPWERYFKALGDDLLTANSISYLGDSTKLSTVDYSLPRYAKLKPDINTNLQYVVNGNLCLCTYYAETPVSTDVVLKLPFTAALAFDINGFLYLPGSVTVTIPAMTQYVRFWYIKV